MENSSEMVQAATFVAFSAKGGELVSAVVFATTVDTLALLFVWLGLDTLALFVQLGLDLSPCFQKLDVHVFCSFCGGCGHGLSCH